MAVTSVLQAAWGRICEVARIGGFDRPYLGAWAVEDDESTRNEGRSFGWRRYGCDTRYTVRGTMRRRTSYSMLWWHRGIAFAGRDDPGKG